MRDEKRHIPLTIRDDTRRQRYAKGGLAKHAEKVKDAGRYGDDMIVHINKDEFEELRRAWGEPTINPETGQPEYFLSGLRKWFQENPIASAVLPAATSILLPGIGSTVGNFLNVGNVLGNYAGTVGNALVGAGIGGLTGGGTGALIGAASGALAPSVAGMFGGIGGGNAASTPGGVRDSSIGASNGVTGGNAGAGRGTGLSLGGMDADKALKLFGGLATIGSAFYKPKDPGLTAAQNRQSAAEAQFNKPLPTVQFNRTRNAMGDPRRYGIDGQATFFADNQLPTVQAAEGGSIERPPRRVNTPTPDSAYGGRKAYWDDRYRPDNYVDVGLGHVPSHPLVYGGTADLAQTVSPVQGVQRQRDMGALDIIREALRGDPDARYKVRGNAREYPTFDNEYARGGHLPGPPAEPRPSSYVQGAGTGRSDEIPALLSDGEYVIDAETVAMLGDGSNKAGAQRLDQMREAVRAHKGKALAKGKFSPNAKHPTKYLGGLQRGRQ